MLQLVVMPRLSTIYADLHEIARSIDAWSVEYCATSYVVDPVMYGREQDLEHWLYKLGSSRGKIF